MGGIALERQALEAFRKGGDRVGEGLALSNLGGEWLYLGDLAQAKHHLEAALSLLRSNSDRVLEGATLGHLSTLALALGEQTRAHELARESLEIAMATEAQDLEIYALIRLGRIELAVGRLSEAKDAYERARKIDLEVDYSYGFHAAAGLASVALAEGDSSAALTALKPVFEFVSGGGALNGTDDTEIQFVCYQTLSRLKDPSAVEWLQCARTALLTQVDTLADAELRHRFLNGLPHRRDIAEAWTQHGAADGSAAAPFG